MCGIAGYLDSARKSNEDKLCATVTGMTDAIHYRGPDDSGAWVDPAAGIALGFRRLAIIDLSPAGHQPMHSADGRYVMTYNGEVYNYEALRQELAPYGFSYKGHSDTEVMLAAISQWGLEEAVTHFIGMFAVALWDRQERKLHLFRDRLGIKPLYYGWAGRAFLYGSELKAFTAHPDFKPEIDRDALTLYMRHSYIPAPYSIYKNVYKLPQGTILTINPDEPGSLPQPRPYWSARDVAERGMAEPFRGTEAEATDALESLLKDAVGLRMIADVPLGAFLSGGIDSSTVVALMQAQSDRPVKTFSIGFHEAEYNEADHARAVAQHLGTDHTELYVTPEEAMAVIPRLPALYDEPFADSSQIPTFLVSQLARRHVTVSLSGDGGDELFAGYPRYTATRDLWGGIGWMPQPFRRAAANGLTALSPMRWNSLIRAAGPLAPERLRVHGGDRLHKIAQILRRTRGEQMYQGVVSYWNDPEQIAIGGHELPTPLTDRSHWASFAGLIPRLMYLDLITYLPDDILAKVDRASMGVSLEARVPLLDHRVVAFVWSLPMAMKLRGGTTKHLLRKVLYRHVPQALVERPKRGFGVPIDHWLRGPIRDWAEALLDERRIKQEGYLNPEPIRQKWDEHLSGGRNWHNPLWVVLMFQAWLEAQGR